MSIRRPGRDEGPRIDLRGLGVCSLYIATMPSIPSPVRRWLVPCLVLIFAAPLSAEPASQAATPPAAARPAAADIADEVAAVKAQPAATQPAAAADDAAVLDWVRIAEEAMPRLKESAALQGAVKAWAEPGEVWEHVSICAADDEASLGYALALDRAAAGDVEGARRLIEAADAASQRRVGLQEINERSDFDYDRAAALAAMGRLEDAEAMVHAAGDPLASVEVLRGMSYGRRMIGDRDGAWIAAERAAATLLEGLPAMAAAVRLDDLEALVESSTGVAEDLCGVGETARVEELADQWVDAVAKLIDEADPILVEDMPLFEALKKQWRAAMLAPAARMAAMRGGAGAGDLADRVRRLREESHPLLQDEYPPISEAAIASELSAAYLALGRNDEAEAEHKRVMERLARSEAWYQALNVGDGFVDLPPPLDAFQPNYNDPNAADHHARRVLALHARGDAREQLFQEMEALKTSTMKATSFYDAGPSLMFLLGSIATQVGEIEAVAQIVRTTDDPGFRAWGAAGIADGMIERRLRPGGIAATQPTPEE